MHTITRFNIAQAVSVMKALSKQPTMKALVVQFFENLFQKNQKTLELAMHFLIVEGV